MVEDVGIDSKEILVITFSKKAANEMAYRFENLTKGKPYLVCFGTFHSIFYSIVKKYYKFDKNSVLRDTDKVMLVKRILKKVDQNDFNESNIQEILDCITACKSILETGKTKDQCILEHFEEIEKIKSFEKIYKEYQNTCLRENRLDFDDMLYMCRKLLYERKEILNEYRKIYKYILVDEFQDINLVQYDVLKMLAGDDKNVFAVGDI